MNKKQIYISRPVEYLSQISQEVQSQCPQASFILDKQLTGCGATFMYLSDGIPTILCSPRTELEKSKADNPYLKGHVYLFRDPDDRKSKVMDLENRLKDYVVNTPLIDTRTGRAQKIITTYDSFKHVAQKLSDLNRLYKYRIVVDEAQTLMTDASFKGAVEMEFLANLPDTNQIIFLSATPLMEKHLDAMPAFQNLPYVELIWPKECYHTANILKLPYYNHSIQATIDRIIQGYFDKGYFEEKMYRGVKYHATEAVLYLNDVRRIIDTITGNGLTPDNTNVICARDENNYKKLAEITDKNGNPLGFTIGHAPQNGQPHKPITLATKCSFEGADFYSPCAYTYIFSDINLAHLGLDISLDVPQIMGRQRLTSNPFRDDATFFYKKYSDIQGMTDAEFQEKINQKIEDTNEWIKTYNEKSTRFQKNMVKRWGRDQKGGDNCSIDYSTLVEDAATGEQKMVFNYLAMQNEKRAWEIQNGQYLDNCLVMSSVDNATFTIADDPLVKDFLNKITRDFKHNMKLYCDFLTAHPDYKEKMEWLPQIPMEIKEYYNALGQNAIRAASYEAKKIDQKMCFSLNEDEIQKDVESHFQPDGFYSFKQIKSVFEEIYEKHGVRRTALATDLKDWAECKQTKGVVDGKKENGYKVIRFKRD